MAERYEHLGPFSDIVAAARASRPPPLAQQTAGEIRQQAKAALHFTVGDEQPIDIEQGRLWERDGVAGTAVSWSVGYGPRTEAWLLKPAGATGKLPGVVALHDHGNFKTFGKEKIADGPEELPTSIHAFRRAHYGGRAFANTLAAQGFAVLVPDSFLWGSRRFPFSSMPAREQALGNAVAATLSLAPDDAEMAAYEGAAYLHETLIEKYLTLLGTSLAAITAYEDRVALNYLREREDVDSDRTAAIGFSGGGLRAAMLGATTELPLVRVIAGMMSTYEALLDHSISRHTWMLFPHGWSANGDLVALAMAGAPAPLLTISGRRDPQFTPEGMRTAHSLLETMYERENVSQHYRGLFHNSGHTFDTELQEAASSWLLHQLAP